MNIQTNIGRKENSIVSSWEEVVYRTTPTNEKKCEAGINFVYAFNRIKPPKIIWFDDHYSASKYLDTQKKSVKVGDKFWLNIYNQLYILQQAKKSVVAKEELATIKKILLDPPKFGYPGFGKFSILNWGQAQYHYLRKKEKPEILTRAIDLYDATGYYLTYDLVLGVRNPEYIYISNCGFGYSSNYYIQYRSGPTWCRYLDFSVSASDFEKLDSHNFQSGETKQNTFYYSISPIECKRCGYKIALQNKPKDIYSCDEMVIKDILE